MKKLISYVLMCAVLAGFYIPASAEETAWKEFYVSESGSDENPGTKEAPFRTIQAAKDAVREVNSEMQGDIVVNIEKGYYYLDDMLDFRTEDSGMNGHRVIYRGEGDKESVISGGYQVEGFTKSEYEGIYVADVEDEAILQLSVNGERRYAAKAANMITGVQKPASRHTEEWYNAHPEDTSRDMYNYHNPEMEGTFHGMYVSKNDFGDCENIQDVLCVWDKGWTTTMVPVEEIVTDPERADVWQITMQPDLWEFYGDKRIFTTQQHVCPNPGRPFTVMNAFELLDEPGEFYYNRATDKLYYMPMAHEDIETAVVIVPHLETIINFDGNDVDDKVKNITFENLQISDSQWDYILGFHGNQATSISGLSLSATAPRAIYAERADGISIKNNIICNIGGSAIDFYNAVTNSEVIGNAIYDIGESALLSGARNHGDNSLGSKVPGLREEKLYNLIPDGISDPVPEEAKDKPIDLISATTTKIHYSFFGIEGGLGTTVPLNYPGYPGPDDHDGWNYNLIHVSWMTDDYDRGEVAWRDTYSPTKGEVPYVTFEFIRPYSINEVVVSFPAEVTEDEKSNYEILVSNDKSFAEGTYKVVATQKETAPEEINHYPLGDGEKYKFVMIRKLSASPLALGRIWVSSSDRKPYVKNQRCKYITFENNAIERVGIDVSRSIGLIVTHGENFTIKHNDIRDVGYSGMSIGYSWGLARNTCYNMDVGYNYVYDTCQTMCDGGGIYVLGPQQNSRYYNNRIEKTNLANQGFYTDNGTRYEIIENNYVENSVRILSPYNANVSYTGGRLNNTVGIAENIFRNNFGTHSLSNDSARNFNDYEDAIVSVVGQPQREAYDTYENAGLEDEYKYVRNYIPEARDNLYTEYDYWEASEPEPDRSNRKEGEKTANITELSNTLNGATFGNGLGMYPLELKAKLSAAIEYFNNGETSDLEMMLANADEFQQELKTYLNRYSLEETLALCEALLAAAKGDAAVDYPAGAADELEAAIEKVKAMPKTTAEQEYDALIALEDAYNTMLSKKYSTEIFRVTMPGAIDSETVIDSASSTVTMYLKSGSSFVTDALEVEAENEEAIARSISGTFDMEKGILVPMRHKGTGEYKIWLVKAEKAPTDGVTRIGKDSEWLQKTTETGFVRKVDEFTNLSGSRYAYMASESAGEAETTIEFKPIDPNPGKNFNVIMGANFAEKFDYISTSSDYNRCELEFVDDKVNFVKVSEGKRTVMETKTSGIKWNEKNELKCQVKEINENTHFTVTLNGQLIFDQVIQKCAYGRFMGFYNADATIRVY